MELDKGRWLVAGATGALGGLLARELADAGARVCVAGRDPEGLAAVAAQLNAPSVALDYAEPGTVPACVAGAMDALGGLDGLVVATGAVAFGDAGSLPRAALDELFTANAVGPIALIEAAVEHVSAVVALSAVVADFPTAGMAAYSASKAALSAHLAALRRERRRAGLHVLDVRPQHLDTGFESRPIAGTAPKLPAPAAAADVAQAIVAALRDDRRELAYDLKARSLVAA
jgi:short-subunit dehydrogenase